MTKNATTVLRKDEAIDATDRGSCLKVGVKLLSSLFPSGREVSPVSHKTEGVEAGVDFFLEEGDGGEIETPKASRERGMGRECPPPQPTRGPGGAS